MLEKLRTALGLLEVAAMAKREGRKTNEHLTKLKRGADEGLEVMGAIGNAVQGEFGLDDTWVLGIKAFNVAPKIDPGLRRRLPWRFIRED
jgi:hypothetical protein